jgi:uncharacterized membrane protein
MYDVLKILHILSVIGWLGSSVVAVLWKVTADRSGNDAIVAHTLNRIRGADALLRNACAVTLLLTGLLMAKVAGLPIGQLKWLWHGLLAWTGAWVLQALLTSHDLAGLFRAGVAAGDGIAAIDATRYASASRRWIAAWSLSIGALVWGVAAMVIKH